MLTVDPEAICTLSGKKTDLMSFKPDPYSLPLLFLPDYLEVDYNICSVVFLRDPVNRPTSRSPR